ncbi:AAA domain-containing protein [Enterococcus hulanensis]|uniref:AAA domain-containing protein n=1 Tax=Enterococcus hulanensis TaxID=2559929 RepID=UPI001F5CC135|nr:AAA domain-containing protein [Enterococcus hulanensis]
MELNIIDNESKKNLEKFQKYFTSIGEQLGADDSKSVEKGFHHSICEQINFYDPSSALNGYLTKQNEHREFEGDMIFPFGLNSSQLMAVEQTFRNQISVVQGPPGTGKTQTILTIIANAIMNNKTIAVVSPNNAATDNVFEKLEKKNLSFIAANLGNTKKTKAFFEKVEPIPKELFEWRISEDELDNFREQLRQDLKSLSQILDDRNRLASLEQELRDWQQEEKYFESYIKNKIDSTSTLKTKLKRTPLIKFGTQKQMKLLVDLNLNDDQQLNFGKKIKYFFRYGIYNFDPFRSSESIQELIDYVEREYYQNKIASVKKEIVEILTFLEKSNYKMLDESVGILSEKIFKSFLSNKYTVGRDRAAKNQVRHDYKAFTKDFPVTLSTCDAITMNIQKGEKFDIVVIDEASMGSLVPSIFPLSVAKNIVIVGDNKQLPNIITNKEEKQKNIVPPQDEAYDYFKHSILSSMEAVFDEELPSVLLKEHYRCHPMIINFCNQEFYNGELIVLSDFNKNEKALVLVETSDGNHMKFDYDKKIFNQREIDSVLSEEFSKACPIIHDMKTTGIVTPFRRQADKSLAAIEKQQKKYVADTVHKFQGRECEAIIFSTVLDNKGSKRNYNFVEDEKLINVAVSRAERLFVLNSSVREFSKRNGSIASLIRHIKYNSDYSLEHKSPVNSIFDLLTKDFQEELSKRRNNYKVNHSKFDSENLMMDMILNILAEEKYKSITCTTEYTIKKLARDFSVLTPDEQQYVRNGARLDFVFYFKTGKEPIAAIEVDGHKFHSRPEQVVRDERKDSILTKLGIRIARFSTNGSEEEKRIRGFLDSLVMEQ